MNELKFELGKKTENAMNQITELFDPLCFGHQVHALALLNSQKTVAQETDADIVVDEIVSKINTILDTLSDRQWIYAMGILNSLMNQHFAKVGMRCEVSTMLDSVISSMGGKQDER